MQIQATDVSITTIDADVAVIGIWSDETLTKLSPHEPEPTGVLVSLESRH